MSEQKAVKDRRILAVLTAVAGVLMFSVVPVAVARAMDAVLKGSALKIQATGNQLLTTGPKIVITFWPFWGGLCITAGVILLYVAWAIYKGQIWAKPVAIGLLALPAITGAYFSGPIMFFNKSAMQYFLIIALIGLIPYFVLLLWGSTGKGEKWSKFFVFLLLGVVAAFSFSNGGSALRIFMARPEPYVLTSGQYGLLLGIPVVWIGVLMVMVSIPLLAAFSPRGYRMAVMGLFVNLVGTAVLYLSNFDTFEFLLGIILIGISLALLLIPSIKGKILRGNA